ncbi:hypothetical protein [Jiangella rhizosphaerae]|uniref:hypothetical protein n=1 Tax=Jiangella rhizosphaerae TaxID=2293569 RepID=UPI0011C368E7|nr:hypothetical protein [Jiangella rhizosphaerae]
MRLNGVTAAAALTAVLLLAGCGDDVPTTGGDDPTSSSTATGDPSGTPTPPTGEPTAPSDEPTDNTEPPTGDPTGVPTDPGTTPQPTPSDTPVPQPTTTPGVTQLTGFPVPGVEAGCWLLDGYLLLGGDQELIGSGREVQITGAVEENVMTTCQQGTPFRVDSVIAIEP